MKKKRLFYLDVIRALATILIFIYHFNTTLDLFHIKTNFPLLENYANGSLGQLGVSLFFIVSGAALMYTYQNNRSLLQFYKKRLLSIFPMFWIAYFLCFVWFDVPNGKLSADLPAWRLIFSVIGMDGYLSPLIDTFYKVGEWFLGCIILLYLVFPLLHYLMEKIPKLLPVLAIIFFIVYTQWYPFEPMIPDRDFLVRIPDFLFGMYFIKYIKKVTPQIAFICFTALFVFFLIPLPINSLICIELVGFTFFLLFVHLSKWIRIILFRDMLSWISKYSYAIFLVHHILILELLLPYQSKVIGSFQFIRIFLFGTIIILICAWMLFQLSEHITKKSEKKNITIPS